MKRFTLGVNRAPFYADSDPGYVFSNVTESPSPFYYYASATSKHDAKLKAVAFFPPLVAPWAWQFPVPYPATGACKDKNKYHWVSIRSASCVWNSHRLSWFEGEIAPLQ